MKSFILYKGPLCETKSNAALISSKIIPMELEFVKFVLMSLFILSNGCKVLCSRRKPNCTGGRSSLSSMKFDSLSFTTFSKMIVLKILEIHSSPLVPILFTSTNF